MYYLVLAAGVFIGTFFGGLVFRGADAEGALFLGLIAAVVVLFLSKLVRMVFVRR